MLTERIVRDAKPEARPRLLWDEQVRGFGVRVTPGGVKSYILNYRVDGRERRLTIGRCAELSLRDARERAAREMVAMRAGEIDPLERRREKREAPTVRDGLARFFDDWAPARQRIGRLTSGTVREYRKHARRYVVPVLGALKVPSVTRRHVERMVDGLPRTQHNRLLAFTSRLFRLFESWGWREQNTNPARGIERAPETPRDRTLAPSELHALSVALDSLADRHPASVAAIRFAAVTGLRIGEVLAIRWADVDVEQARLTIPEGKTGRRQHDLPIPALDLFGGIHRINDEWAFSTGRSHVTYRHVRTVFAEAVRVAGLLDVRLHDLRRGVMTRAAAAGVGTHVLRDLLGHRTTVMADRYVRALGSPVREAREAIGAEIAAAMAREGARD
jgi:integrase